LTYLDISQAQGITKGGGVTVAVIDTGVAPHPDIKRNLLNGTTVVPGDSGNGHNDQEDHGTMMAGIIAGHGHGTQNGVLGIAPAAKILPIRVTAPGKTGNSMTIAAGITWAAANGAKVLNISLAAAPGLALDDAIKLAEEKDLLVVAGSGNRPRDLRFGYPAAMPGVLGVGASDRSGQFASITVKGEPMGICAPGIEITTTGPKGKYFEGSGTSEATAVVSGAAALVRARFPELSAPEVIHRLQATATDIGKPGRDEECGFGVLNIVKALTAEVPPLGNTGTVTAQPTAAPTAATSAPAVPGTGSEAPKTTPAAGNTPAIVGGGVIVLLFGGLIAFLVARKRRTT
jgi:type VII secretion-associated serine protease mycosin